MLFSEYIAILSTSEQTEINSILDMLRGYNDNWRNMISNLYRESTFDQTDWQAIHATLVTKPIDRRRIRSEIVTFCETRILAGRRAKTRYDTEFGKIISFEWFCDILVRLRHYPSMKAAEAGVRMRIGKSITSMGVGWKDIKLGEKIIWSTFQPTQPFNPFAIPYPTTGELVCSLGLDPMPHPILLFQYSLPPTVIAKIPTFCDAHFRPNWNKYFVRTRSEEYGMTRPADGCTTTTGRPEVVHGVITAENLTRPIRFA